MPVCLSVDEASDCRPRHAEFASEVDLSLAALEPAPEFGCLFVGDGALPALAHKHVSGVVSVRSGDKMSGVEAPGVVAGVATDFVVVYPTVPSQDQAMDVHGSPAPSHLPVPEGLAGERPFPAFLPSFIVDVAGEKVVHGGAVVGRADAGVSVLGPALVVHGAEPDLFGRAVAFIGGTCGLRHRESVPMTSQLVTSGVTHG